jgi:hypothetical protein
MVRRWRAARIFRRSRISGGKWAVIGTVPVRLGWRAGASAMGAPFASTRQGANYTPTASASCADAVCRFHPQPSCSSRKCPVRGFSTGTRLSWHRCGRMASYLVAQSCNPAHNPQRATVCMPSHSPRSRPSAVAATAPTRAARSNARMPTTRHDLIRSGCQEQRSMRLSAVTPAARMNSRRPAHAISHKFTPPIHKIAQLFASDCGAAAPP